MLSKATEITQIIAASFLPTITLWPSLSVIHSRARGKQNYPALLDYYWQTLYCTFDSPLVHSPAQWVTKIQNECHQGTKTTVCASRKMPLQSPLVLSWKWNPECSCRQICGLMYTLCSQQYCGCRIEMEQIQWTVEAQIYGLITSPM